MNDLNKTFQELNTEDIIWIISLFTASFAIYSNYLERNYVYTHNKKSKTRYKTINITIGVIAFFIYLYFFLLSYQRIQENNKVKQQKIREANFIAASFILIASVIYLLTEILSDEDTEIDLLI